MNTSLCIAYPAQALRWIVMALVLLMATAYPFQQLYAVPPTPPAVLELDTKVIEGKLEGMKGDIGLPIAVTLDRKILSLDIKALISVPKKQPFKFERQEIFTKTHEKLDTKRLEYFVPIKVKEAGHQVVEIVLKGKIDKDNGFSDRKLRHVIVDKEGKYRILTPKQYVQEERKAREKAFETQLKKDPRAPDIRILFLRTVDVPEEESKKLKPLDVPPDKQLRVRPSGPSETLKKYSKDRSDSSWAPEDPITVQGRITYLDHDGVWRALVNVSVNLWDDDTFFDDYLGVTATDWGGYWSFTVNNDDGWLQDGRDLYYTFKLENTRLRVQDCDGIDSTYEWASEVHNDLSDGIVLDFGTDTGVEHPNSMQIWGHLNLAWNHAAGTGAQDPGFVDSCFPEPNTWWDSFWEEIDIEAGFNNGPDVVTHEYGHAFMWYAYGDDDPSPGGSHTFDGCPQGAGLAWSEGWATGFMLSARPDGIFNWHEGDTGRNIENFNSTCQTGERNEGRVAAAINDMRDSPDDCNGGNLNRGRNGYCDENVYNRVPLSTIMRDTLWGSFHDDVLEFWSSLSGELTSAQRSPAHTIMYYNWMAVTDPDACVATKVVAQETKEPDSVLGGLRLFRDNALKNFDGGRQLANLYYRNSPELALLLLKDSKLREQSLRVIQHFSEMGYEMTSTSSKQQADLANEPFIPYRLMQSIDSILRKLDERGSKELKNDVRLVSQTLNKVRGLSMYEVQHKVEQTKAKRKMNPVRRLEQSKFTPQSAKAINDKALRKYRSTQVKPPKD